MKHRVKKLLGLILVFTMIIAPVIPAAAVDEVWSDFADTTWYDGHESETEFSIGTAEQFSGMIKLLTRDRKDDVNYFKGKTIRLTDDIDLSGKEWVNGWVFMGSNGWFSGTLEGDGHVIKYYTEGKDLTLFPDFPGEMRNLGIVSEGAVNFIAESQVSGYAENCYAYSKNSKVSKMPLKEKNVYIYGGGTDSDNIFYAANGDELKIGSNFASMSKDDLLAKLNEGAKANGWWSWKLSEEGYPTFDAPPSQSGSPAPPSQSDSPAPGNPQGETDKPVDANAGQKTAVKEALASGAKELKLTYTEGNKIVDKEIFRAIAEKDITVTFNMGDAWWIVNGTDIPADTDFKDLNLGVTVDRDGTKKLIPVEVINPLTGEVKTIQCELLHNGPFGFKMYLHINLGKEFAGMTVLLRYYNEATGMLEEVTSGAINSDGIVLLPMEHASKYVLSIGAAGMSKQNVQQAQPAAPVQAPVEAAPKSPKTGENNRMVYFLILTAVAGIGVAMVAGKRKWEK